MLLVLNQVLVIVVLKAIVVWVSLIILWILCCRLGQIITSAVLSGLVHYQVVGLNIASGLVCVRFKLEIAIGSGALSGCGLKYWTG